MSEDDRSPIRQPSAAGPFSFYPSDPVLLRAMVQECLSHLKFSPWRIPKGLIVPHAGYIYSGRVAGWAFQQAADTYWDAIVIMGPSHFYRSPAISIMPRGVYRTPLGDVPINEDVAAEIARLADDAAVLSQRGHIVDSRSSRAEHSIEVQLPFLIEICSSLSIVPILIGDAEPEALNGLSAALSQIDRDGRILFIASSDLSHYHPEEDARRLDRMAIDRITAFDADGFWAGCRSRQFEACGSAPVYALLKTLQQLGATDAVLFNYATSADIAYGDRSAVVGYAAVGFYFPDD